MTRRRADRGEAIFRGHFCPVASRQPTMQVAECRFGIHPVLSRTGLIRGVFKRVDTFGWAVVRKRPMKTHLKYLATGALLITLGFLACGLLLGYVWLLGEYYEATMLVTVAVVLITASYVIGRLVWEGI